MSIPSGYKRLEYIRATGTQYLDLGVTMEKTDSVTLEATMTLDAPSDTRYFGANGYMQIAVTSGGYSINGLAMKPLGKQDVVKCVFASVTESLYINNVLAESKNWSSYNASNTKIGLFKMGDPSNGWYSGAALSGNLYGGTLIKDGVTVCNVIPCKNASGVVGVWDDAAGVFRGSAGTSNFVAGPELIGDNRVLVDAKGYDAKTWTVLIGGMGYHIKKGRGLIDGKGYDIPFYFDSGTPISGFAVGTTVKIRVNGTLRDFLIVHQGLPGPMYNSSCNGTWLLMKDIYENRQWNSSNVNVLERSTIHSYLNSTFLNLLDSSLRSAIKQVKIPYRQGGGSNGTTLTGANGLSAKVILLSGGAVGLAWASTTFPKDGSTLEYFNTGGGSKRIAYLNGSASSWWLRSPNTDYTDVVWAILSNGSYDYLGASGSYGIRPAFVIPADTLVRSDGTIT